MRCPHLTPGEYAHTRALYYGCPDCAEESEEYR